MNCHRPLKAEHCDLLEHGVEVGYRSEAVWSVVLGMVNAGWTFAEYLDAFNNPRNQLARFFETDRRGRTYGRERRNKRLHMHWRRASAWVAANPAVASRAEARQELGLMISDALAHPMTPIDQHVLLAVMMIATRAGRVDPTVSQRQLAEAVGMPRSTVRDALARLEQAGRLTLSRDRQRGEARRIRVRPARGRALTIATESTALAASVEALRQPNDLWCAWGQHARAIYMGLSSTPTRASVLAEMAAVSKRTAQRWLKTLTATGLATAAPDCTYVIGDSHVSDVARDIGADGLLERRRLRHELDRQGLAAATARQKVAA